jgi:hypothetical protein
VDETTIVNLHAVSDQPLRRTVPLCGLLASVLRRSFNHSHHDSSVVWEAGCLAKHTQIWCCACPPGSFAFFVPFLPAFDLIPYNYL